MCRSMCTGRLKVYRSIHTSSFRYSSGSGTYFLHADEWVTSALWLLSCAFCMHVKKPCVDNRAELGQVTLVDHSIYSLPGHYHVVIMDIFQASCQILQRPKTIVNVHERNVAEELVSLVTGSSAYWEDHC